MKPALARLPEADVEEPLEELLALLVSRVASGPDDGVIGTFTRFARALRSSFRRELEVVERAGADGTADPGLILREQGQIRELLAAAERSIVVGQAAHARWDLRELQVALALHRRRRLDPSL